MTQLSSPGTPVTARKKAPHLMCINLVFLRLLFMHAILLIVTTPQKHRQNNLNLMVGRTAQLR